MGNKRVALIVIDAQNDFGRKTGALYVPGGEQVVPVINGLRVALKTVGVHDVVLTQDWHPADHMSFAKNNPGSTLFTTIDLPNGTKQMMWPDHCVQGSSGADFLDDLVIAESDFIVQKGSGSVDSYSGFGSADRVSEITPLLDHLKRLYITHVVIAGLAYDYCVSYTARDAAHHGFQTCVVRDACMGISPVSSNMKTALMLEAGVTLVANASGACDFAN
jgi:nicotinamidase/pyrazinamidase